MDVTFEFKEALTHTGLAKLRRFGGRVPGPAGECASTGPVGCMVELQKTQQTRKLRLALTQWHAEIAVRLRPLRLGSASAKLTTTL
jgi:hypothetical protein